MPFTNKFLEERDIVITTWTGQPEDEELIRFYMSLYNHPHWRSNLSEIIDLRDADLSNISHGALEDLSEMTTQALNGNTFLLAILAPSTVDHHLARIYEAFTHVPNDHMRVCHHMSEALDWIGEQRQQDA